MSDISSQLAWMAAAVGILLAAILLIEFASMPMWIGLGIMSSGIIGMLFCLLQSQMVSSASCAGGEPE